MNNYFIPKSITYQTCIPEVGIEIWIYTHYKDGILGQKIIDSI